jgi:hypothetical protein
MPNDARDSKRRLGVRRGRAARPSAQELSFERLEDRLALAADFGDAPSPFPTLLADNGPRHEAVGPLLGTQRDAEVDGLPTVDATGDGSDDDGVQFALLRVGQRGASWTVTVSNASTGARLDAWIDFNGDGLWSGPYEQIAASVPVVNGVNLLAFDVPVSIADGLKFARVRLSEAGGLTPSGEAPNGEVEDLTVAIAPPAAATGEFHPTIVYQTADYGDLENVTLVDLDRDGDLDFLGEGQPEYQYTISWYTNNGAAGYAPQLIDSGLTHGVNQLVPVDLDQDGDLDIVAAPGLGMRWYENNGFQGFTRRDFPGGFGLSRVLEVAPADIDVDGDVDLFASVLFFGNGGSEHYGTVLFENDGSQQFTMQSIYPFGGFRGLNALDIDSDGDVDLIVHLGNALSLFENDGAENFTYQTILPVMGGDSEVIDSVVADIDGDGDSDILAIDGRGHTKTNRSIFYYENLGSRQFARHELESNFYGFSKQIRAGDMDGDGDMDAVITASIPFGASGSSLAILENDGQQNFVIRQIAAPYAAYENLHIVDHNNDGDLDIVSTGNTPHWIVVQSQRDNRVNVAASVPAVSEGASQPIAFTFTRSGHLASALTVSFSVQGTALFGADYSQSGAASYSALAGTVMFAPGQATAVVNITPAEDALRESDESIRITIDSGSAYVVGGTSVAEGAIVDNDVGDFGDAPAPYPVLLAHDGPRHTATGPRLGANRDEELDGAPSANADGDDQASAPDDEDGIAFQTVRVGLVTSSVIVDVQNAPTGAMLDAWIDFNGDGSWDAPDERIAASLRLVAGANTVAFATPAGARSGVTFARFRLSTAGGLNDVGVAADGEVEDVALTIEPPASGRDFGAPVALSPSIGVFAGMALIDLDRDGDEDIVGAGSSGFSWNENVGNGAYTSHALWTNFANSYDFKPADFDGDGDLDLAVASIRTTTSGHIGWLENDGAQTFVFHDFGFMSDPPRALATADLDSDGDVDFAVVGSMDDGNYWYENDGHGAFTRHFFGTPHANFGTYESSVDAADVDRDGDIDLLTGGTQGVAWHENVDGAFVFRSLTDVEWAQTHIVDLDRDGDADLVAFGSAAADMVWFENDGSQNFQPHEVLAPGPVGGRNTIVDLDGDGDWDVVSALGSSGVDWFENDGAQQFTRRTIGAIANASAGRVAAGDYDGDGDLDLLVAQSSGSPAAAWYKNVEQTASVAAAAPLTSAEDGPTPFVLTFTRQGDVSAPLTLFFTVGGTAQFSADYSQSGAASFGISQGSVAFNAGQTTSQVTLTPKTDAVYESDETIVITVRPGVEIAAVPPTAAAMSIRDAAVDLGDAPSRYKTLRADGGAGHVATGPLLGLTRDAELDGAPSTAADGDDLAGADEDGVVFAPLRVGQYQASATVRVAGAPAGGAYLSAWIDFDGDGSWSDAGERIADAFVIQNGDTVLYFDVPPTALPGSVYARFRLSTAPVTAPAGLAASGEVEDYRITIAPVLPAGDVFVTAATIANAILAIPADVDHDGDGDIIAFRTQVFPYVVAPFNNVAEQFTPQAGWQTTTSSITAIVPVGFAQNGNFSVVVSRGLFSLDSLTLVQRIGTNYTTRVIASNGYQAASRPIVIDFDNDGDLDVVAASSSQGVVWYEERGTFFAPHTLVAGQANAIDVADMDGDGDFDVVVAATSGIKWWENRGADPYLAHSVDVLPNGGARDAYAADVDRDGDLDLVAHLNLPASFAWYENAGGSFTKQALNFTSQGVHTLQPVDFDGDGDLDVLGASSTGVVLFTFGPAGFTPRTLATGNFVTARAADVDQDGDLDVLATNTAGSAIWFESIASADGDADGNVQVDGNDFLAWQRGLGATVAKGSGADANGDGKVAASDLPVWKATFGAVLPVQAIAAIALAETEFEPAPELESEPLAVATPTSNFASLDLVGLAQTASAVSRPNDRAASHSSSALRARISSTADAPHERRTRQSDRAAEASSSTDDVLLCSDDEASITSGALDAAFADFQTRPLASRKLSRR